MALRLLNGEKEKYSMFCLQAVKAFYPILVALKLSFQVKLASLPLFSLLVELEMLYLVFIRKHQKIRNQRLSKALTPGICFLN